MAVRQFKTLIKENSAVPLLSRSLSNPFPSLMHNSTGRPYYVAFFSSQLEGPTTIETSRDRWGLSRAHASIETLGLP